jgi:hypothetical protein
MSGSPKYSPVSVSAARQRELEARQAAERQRVAEAERKRREEILHRLEQERRERRERIERRRAEVEQRRQQSADAARQRIEDARAQRELRIEQGKTARGTAAGYRAAQPDRRERPAYEPLVPDPLPQGDAIEELAPALPDARTMAALAELAQHSAAPLAQAAVLLAEGARHAELASRLVAVEGASSALEQALADDDELSLAAALQRTQAELDTARREHEGLLEQEARRRTIAEGVARALPDRYVHDGAFTPGPDGSIHFSARTLDQELRIAIVSDGVGGEVVACQAEGDVFETHVYDGVEVHDCPALSAELAETNERLLHDGFVPGTWTWPGAATERQAAELSKQHTKPGTEASKKRSGR